VIRYVCNKILLIISGMGFFNNAVLDRSFAIDIVEICIFSRDELKREVMYHFCWREYPEYRNNQVLLYVTIKKVNELLAYTYSKLYGIPSMSLGFFSIYGLVGRLDMVYLGFANK